jgi:hypothetical protein
LPSGDLNKLAQLILTGGGSQTISEGIVARLMKLLSSSDNSPGILIDRNYQIWAQGISWSERSVAASAG